MTSYDDGNVFAKILRGELPAVRVHEDERNIAIMDVMPQADGHVLVIPKTRARNLLDVDDAALEGLLPLAARLARAVRSAFAADGVSLMQFNEAAGGQSVFHLHLHVIPRHHGVALRHHGGGMAPPETLERHAAMIRDALAAAQDVR
jgi:histidine triad (HIT) family protein